MVYLNGDKYSGDWADGKKHGFGIYLLSSKKMKLKGQWEQGQFKNGKWFLENGDYYEGKFEQNFPYGDGKWVRTDGMEDTGRYEHVTVEPEQDSEEEKVDTSVVKNEIYKVEECAIRTVWVGN